MAVPKGKCGLGMKQLHHFNISLLAKQGWRILTNPETLVARVFKACYFPKKDFLQAMLGNNPSYIWHNILAGQSVIRNGVGRRVGNGRSTSIWKDPWLHDTSNPYVCSIPSPHIDNDLVASLMMPGGIVAMLICSRRPLNRGMLTASLERSECGTQ